MYLFSLKKPVFSPGRAEILGNTGRFSKVLHNWKGTSKHKYLLTTKFHYGDNSEIDKKFRKI